MTMLSPNFTVEHFIRSSEGSRYGIANDPTPEILANLIVTAEGCERVRLELGCPVIISSGYRCPEINCIVGGAMTLRSLQQLVATSQYHVAVAHAQARINLGHGAGYQNDDSAHMLGKAGDLESPLFGSPLNVCRRLVEAKLRVNFDQIIWEYPDERGTGGWAHCAFVAPDVTPRYSVLTKRAGQPYMMGIPS